MNVGHFQHYIGIKFQFYRLKFRELISKFG